MNSFRFLERGIAAEIERQIAVLEGGGEVVQETMHFDPASGRLPSLRSKEEATTTATSPSRTCCRWSRPRAPRRAAGDAAGAAAGPHRAAARDYGIPEGTAEPLGARRRPDRLLRGPRRRAWTTRGRRQLGHGRALGAPERDRRRAAASPGHAGAAGRLVGLVGDGTLGSAGGKQVFAAMSTTRPTRPTCGALGLGQIADQDALGAMVDEVIAAQPDEAETYRGGKQPLLGFFIGQVMRGAAAARSRRPCRTCFATGSADTHLLLTPGPTPIPPDVAAAMARPLPHHRTREFKALLVRVLASAEARLPHRARRDAVQLERHGGARVRLREPPLAGRPRPGRLRRQLRRALDEDGEAYGAVVEVLRWAWGSGPTPTRSPRCERPRRPRAGVGRPLRDLDRARPT